MARPADPHARTSLIQAARAAFAENGIVGARIEDITRACGLSKGAFYLHFPSKEALFREVVSAMVERLGRCTEHRMEAIRRFFEEKGPISSRDIQKHTRHYEDLIALETALDVEVLELLWEYRDVIAVLTRGSQGTEFETLVWQMADAEVKRVAEQFQYFQGTSACREDVPPHVFGTVIVGTYLLVGQQMAGAKERPDFHSLAQAIQRLIREGSTGPAPSRFFTSKEGTVHVPSAVIAPSRRRPARRKAKKGRAMARGIRVRDGRRAKSQPRRKP
jgi:AcrR family transcriptional regulator